MDARKTAFIGLGVMGFPMAGHLARTGHSVTVYNRTAAKAQACALGVRYVYYGARLYGFDRRELPPLAVLASSPGLQEVFHSGDAVVFKTRLTCS